MAKKKDNYIKSAKLRKNHTNKSLNKKPYLLSTQDLSASPCKRKIKCIKKLFFQVF